MNRIIVATDGGQVAGKRSAWDGASAFIIYKNDVEIKRFGCKNEGKTGNYSEMLAIYKASKFLLAHLELLEGVEEILFATDSELCQKSLTTWMFGWLSKATNEVLYGSSGLEVANQELVKSTFINILLLQSKISVCIAHVNSHKPEKEIPNMYTKFIKSKELPMEDFKLIYYGNKACDEIVNQFHKMDIKNKLNINK